VACLVRLPLEGPEGLGPRRQWVADGTVNRRIGGVRQAAPQTDPDAAIHHVCGHALFDLDHPHRTFPRLADELTLQSIGFNEFVAQT